MTAAIRPLAPDDPAVQAHRAYVARDFTLLRSLADIYTADPDVQLQAARLATDTKQADAALRYLGATAKADVRAAFKSWEYWHIMSAVQALLGDYGEAEAAVTMALRLAPSQPLLWTNAAAYSFHRGDAQEGHVRLQRCLSARCTAPEDEWAQGEVQLYLGNYKAGWRLWRSRVKMRAVIGGNTATLGLPEWTGRGAERKTLLVWGEQGHGDQLQFLRFVPLLRSKAKRIVLRLAPSLMPWATELLETGCVDELTTGDTLASADLQVPLLSVPGWLGINREVDVPEPWKPRHLERAPVSGRVGYCWRGNPKHGNDNDRSCPDRDLFGNALDAPGRDLVNLTGEDTDGPKGTWLETAALLATCERVVSVDTAIAHLAGSLGVPCLTIIPSAPEWRWGHRGHTSPWYPSMTVLRKRYMHGWDDVLAQAAERL